MHRCFYTWEEWLGFFLDGITEVSKEAAETARRIVLLREQHRTAVTEHVGRAAANAHKVLEMLFANPIITVSQVKEWTGTSYPAANQLVSRLVELDILRERTGQKRNRRFEYGAYINLFNDGPQKGHRA